jgi:predicted nucleotidyltransferase
MKFDRSVFGYYNRGMISEHDKLAIIDLARRYGVGRVLLFGSAADPIREARDIDLAVEGLAADKFFTFYGDLLFGLSKPVDLIDLAKDTKFNRLVAAEGICLYG